MTMFLSRFYDSRYLFNYLVGKRFCDHKKTTEWCLTLEKLPPAKRALAIFLRREPGLSIPKLLKNATYQHHGLIRFLRRVSVMREETGLLRKNWPPKKGVNKTWNMEHSGTSRNRANYHKINAKKSNKKC